VDGVSGIGTHPRTSSDDIFQSSSHAWREAEARTAVRMLSNGRGQCVLSIPDLRCGGCVATIERALNARPDVASARVNLTLKQAVVTFANADTDPTAVISALALLGYPAIPAGVAQSDEDDTDNIGRGLLTDTILDPLHPGLIHPDQPHSVEPLGPMRMRVDFHAQPPDVLPT